jgi:hypothetical protein
MADRGPRQGGALAAALAAAALVSCGGSPAVPEEAGPAADRTAAAHQLISDAYQRRPAVRIPAGFQVRHVTAERLSLAFPRRWTALAQPDVVFPGVIRTLSRAHRSLTPSLLGLAAPDSPLKLLAFHGRAGEDFATTASVFVGPAPPGASFERQRQAIVRTVRKLSGLQGQVDVRRLTLPAGEALRLEYARKGTATVQYVTVRGDRLYALVYTTLPALKSRYTRDFELSARTLSVDG